MQDIRIFFAHGAPATQSAPSTSSQVTPAEAAAAEIDLAEPASTRRRLNAEQPSPFTDKLQTGRSKCGLCGCVPPPSRTIYSIAMTSIWSVCRKNGVTSLCLCSGCHNAHGSKLAISSEIQRMRFSEFVALFTSEASNPSLPFGEYNSNSYGVFTTLV